MLVDIGLTWRVSPKVSEGRTSRIMARMMILSWEAIVRRLLEEISVRVVIDSFYFVKERLKFIGAAVCKLAAHFLSSKTVTFLHLYP